MPPKTPSKGGKAAAKSGGKGGKGGKSGSSTKKADAGGANDIKEEDKKGAASSAMSRLTARPGADEVLVRFAQRVGARQYDLRGDLGLLRPIMIETLVRWLGSSPEHNCVPLMTQAASAMASLALNSDEDALLLVELGVIDFLLNLLDEAILPCKTFAEKTWRTGCGTASTTTLWALCQINATVGFVTDAGAINPIIRLCKVTQDEAVLKLTTAAITDMCDKDKHRVLVFEGGGLEVLGMALDKVANKKLMIQKEAPIIRKNVATALQNLSLSVACRNGFIAAGIVERLMELCLMTDTEKKLIMPHQVIASCIAVFANLAYEPRNGRKMIGLGVPKFLVKLLDVCRSGAVVTHICVCIRNMAMRKSTPDWQAWVTEKDEKHQNAFGEANALKVLVDLCGRYMPPNNDNFVLENVLNCLVALVWNHPKNRMRMANKDIIDISVITSLASHGPRLNANIRQRLAILLADLAQLPSMRVKLAESGLMDNMYRWLHLPTHEAITRFCAGGAVMNLVAEASNSSRFGKANDAARGKGYIACMGDILRGEGLIDSLVMNLSGTLANLSFKNDLNKQKMWQAGVLQSLISNLDRPQTPSDGQMRKDLMIAALLMNLTAGAALRSKIVGMGVIPLLLKIVNGGRNKNMMRYALGALRNLAMESTVQKLMVKEGVLDALVNVWELFGDDDTFADGSMPQEHAACVLRNLCIDDDVRHTVRKSNKLQSLSRIADPASPPILEEYVTVKPDLTPHEVMSYSLCRGGGVVKQRFGTTDDEFNAFPVGKYEGALNCDHLENDESAQHAWECLLDVMNELYLTFEAPHENAERMLTTPLSTAEEEDHLVLGPMTAPAAMDKDPAEREKTAPSMGDASANQTKEEEEEEEEEEEMAKLPPMTAPADMGGVRFGLEQDQHAPEVLVVGSRATTAAPATRPPTSQGAWGTRASALALLDAANSALAALEEGGEGGVGMAVQLLEQGVRTMVGGSRGATPARTSSRVAFQEHGDSLHGRQMSTGSRQGNSGGGLNLEGVGGDADASWDHLNLDAESLGAVTSRTIGDVTDLIQAGRELMRDLPSPIGGQVYFALTRSDGLVAAVVRGLACMALQCAWRNHAARRALRVRRVLVSRGAGGGPMVSREAVRRITEHAGWGIASAILGGGEELAVKLARGLSSVRLQCAVRCWRARGVLMRMRRPKSTVRFAASGGLKAKQATEAHAEDDPGMPKTPSSVAPKGVLKSMDATSKNSATKVPEGKEAETGDEAELAKEHGFAETPIGNLMKKGSSGGMA